MNILCVVPSYYPAFQFGGPITSVHNLNKSFVKRGVDVTVYTTNVGLEDKVETNKEVLVDGVKVFYFTFYKLFEFAGPTGWQFSIPLSKALKKNIPNFDLVYISAIWNYPTAIAAYYCRKYNKPYVVAPRGIFYPYTFNKKVWKKWPYYKLIVKKILEEASAIHYTSIDEFEKGHSFLGIKNNKTFIVPNGLDLSEFKNLPLKEILRDKYSILKGKKVILFLSRLDWKKGLDILAKAYGDISKKRNNIHLLVVGDGPENFKEKVKEWFRKEGIFEGEKITFTGMLTGKERLEALSGSDIFVLPSYSENFGMAIVEAMACGLPVITTNTVGVYHEIIEANAGLIVPCDPVQVGKALLKIIDNEELAKELSKKGKKLTAELFDFGEIADKIIEEFRKIIA